MARLSDHLRKRPNAKARADAIAHRIFTDEVENAAMRILLVEALKVIENDPAAVPALTIQERIKSFLERHPR